MINLDGVPFYSLSSAEVGTLFAQFLPSEMDVVVVEIDGANS